MNLHRFTTSTFLVRQTAKVEASLRCRLVTRGHPALLLQPAKVEEQSLDPMIVVLHDLLTDKQTEILRQLGEPKVRHILECLLHILLKLINVRNFLSKQLASSLHRGGEGKFVRSMIRTSKK